MKYPLFFVLLALVISACPALSFASAPSVSMALNPFDGFLGTFLIKNHQCTPDFGFFFSPSVTEFVVSRDENGIHYFTESSPGLRVFRLENDPNESVSISGRQSSAILDMAVYGDDWESHYELNLGKTDSGYEIALQERDKYPGSDYGTYVTTEGSCSYVLVRQP